MFLKHSYISVLFFVYLTQFARGDTEEEITIRVKPGSSECFYITIKVGDEFDIEYQVGENIDLYFDVHEIFIYVLLSDILYSSQQYFINNRSLNH